MLRRPAGLRNIKSGWPKNGPTSEETDADRAQLNATVKPTTLAGLWEEPGLTLMMPDQFFPFRGHCGQSFSDGIMEMITGRARLH